tara:strand:+ start:746 stop:922 length:177 start_codon:yes stop_codon:yes gene_type:complete
MTISKHKSNNEVATKVRVDLALEEKARQSDENILVREKYKPFREIKNPDYNPNNRRKQ